MGELPVPVQLAAALAIVSRDQQLFQEHQIFSNLVVWAAKEHGELAYGLFKQLIRITLDQLLTELPWVVGEGGFAVSRSTAKEFLEAARAVCWVTFDRELELSSGAAGKGISSFPDEKEEASFLVALKEMIGTIENDATL